MSTPLSLSLGNGFQLGNALTNIQCLGRFLSNYLVSPVALRMKVINYAVFLMVLINNGETHTCL